jgi:hypothetical protein
MLVRGPQQLTCLIRVPESVAQQGFMAVNVPPLRELTNLLTQR